MIKAMAGLSAVVAFAAGDELVTLLIVCVWLCAFVASLARSSQRSRQHDIHADDFYF